MANQLKMDKSLAINNLRAAGYSERRIARTLNVSRGAVRRHLAGQASNGTKAPTGPEAVAPTGSDDSNSTKAPTGSGDEAAPADPADLATTSSSQCEPFRQVISEKQEAGLSARRIHQDLVADHGASVSYWSVNRFVKSLDNDRELPFRRMEIEPGEELQVDFGTGAKIRNADGTHRRTHVFRAVLSHSRKGYAEVVFRQDTESFIRCLENTFWAFGGVPMKVIFDNAKCAVKTPDFYDPELNPKLVDFCKHDGCAFMPTRVRTPRHKGKVERGVDYVQENNILNPMLTKLRLGGMTESLEVRLHEASSTGLTHMEFFELMLQDEINIREDRQIARRIKKAGFRDVRRLEDLDFSFNTTIKKSAVFELATGRFIRERRDVLWLGPPGTGKSHLSQAIGLSLIRAGMTVYYRSIFDVVRDFLHDEALDGHERILKRYLEPDLLIIDDMGMKQLPKRSGEYLFEVIMRRHDVRSTMMTSNRPLEEWANSSATCPARRLSWTASCTTVT